MATSSIFHSIKITTKSNADNFVRTLQLADKKSKTATIGFDFNCISDPALIKETFKLK